MVKRRFKEDISMDLVPQQMKASAKEYGDIKINLFVNGNHVKSIGQISIPKNQYEFVGNKVIVNPSYRPTVEKNILELLKNHNYTTKDIPFEYEGEFKISGKNGAIELSVSKNRILVKEI